MRTGAHVPPTHIIAEGDAPKVERTRHYFSAIVAGLKTAQEYAAQLERDCRRYRDALEQIAETSRWYANNGQRLAHEVDHALCVEIVATAERALETGVTR